jgi:hypothetical protein
LLAPGLALEDLSRAVNAADNHKPPIAEVGERMEENRGLHVLAGVNHSLTRVSHTLMRGWLEGMWLVSVEAEEDINHNGEESLVLNLEEEIRSRFKNFDLRSKPNSTENTTEEGEDP